MLSSVAVGVLLGLGFGAWVYSKVMRQTGGNIKQSTITASIAGGMGFVLVVTVMSLIDSAL